ncbi:MAG: twin-arginine translocase subunit TatC [Nonlabens sp.]
MARRETDPNNMSFLDHVEELRWMLIRSIIGILIGAVIAFIFKKFIIDVVLLGPSQADFVSYQAFCDVATWLGVDSEFCDPQLNFETQTRKMPDLFSAHIWTSITVGFIIAIPWVLYQIWKFIAPGLKPAERKYSKGFIFFSSLLFFIGAAFGYYLIAPLSVHFLATYDLSENIKFEPDLNSYIGLVRACVLSCGLMFELPIIVYFLTKIGLCTPAGMRQYRKYALVLVLIIAAVITPPDIQSQIIVAIPVLILYEISIFISALVLRRQRKKLKRSKAL